MPKETVLIAGCGVFGLSTALELVKKGYTVEMIDKYQPPSPWSAACDFNKILRCEYNKPMYSKLAVEALHEWRSNSLFNATLNECGRLLVTPLSHKGRIEYEKIGIKNLNDLGEGLKYDYYNGGESIKKKFKQFKNNSIPINQEVKFNPESGLGHSADTLVNVFNRLQKLEVKFTFGSDGEAISIKRLNNNKSALVTKSGKIYTADKIIIALGANTGKVIDLENQQAATGLFVTHIQLNNKEYEFYKDMPILFDAEMGYFFPPDPKTKILKICLSGGGIKRIVKNPFGSGEVSLPRFHNEFPQDTIPRKSIENVYKLLKRYVPDLEDHELFGSKICWIGDAENSDFIIDKIPKFSNLYVATGDSGHGFKFFPNIGKYIVQKLEGSLDNEKSDAWQWKDGKRLELVDPAKITWRVSNGTFDISEIDFRAESPKVKL